MLHKKLSKFMKQKALLLFFGLLTGLNMMAQEKLLPSCPYYCHVAKIYDDTLFAASEKGLYAYPLRKENPKWEIYGFEGIEVANFVKSGSKVLAVCLDVQGEADKPFFRPSDGVMSLFCSEDGCETFYNVTPVDFVQNTTYYTANNVGVPVNFIQQTDDEDHYFMTYPINTKDIDSDEYDGKVVESVSFSHKCESRPLRVPLRSRFALAPQKADEVLLYGQSKDVNSSCSYLAVTKDNFQTLSDIPFDIDYETGFLSIEFCPANEQQLIAATGKGIAKSDDGGLTWSHKLYWQSAGTQKVLYDASDPNVAYAVCCLMSDWNLYQLVVYRSTDRGDTWGEMYNGMVVGKPDCMMVYGDRLYVISNSYEGPGTFLSIPSDGSATAIESMTKPFPLNNDTRYDLSGKAVRKPQKNKVIIQNGKKYIVK